MPPRSSEPLWLRNVRLQGGEGEGVVRQAPRPRLWDISIGCLTLGALGAQCAKGAPRRLHVLVAGEIASPAEDTAADMVLA